MKDIFDIIKKKIKLHDYALKVMKLKFINDRYVGLCPFHNEKTPSFYINPAQNLFYCFGCHKGGDLFTFYCEVNNCDKKKALRELSAMAGIKYASEVSKNDLNCLLDFFKMQTGHIKWLENRGISIASMNKFQLGFSSSFVEMQRYIKVNRLNLNNLGFKDNLLKSLQNRIMFPIFNEIGSLISFSGRSLEVKCNYKYINGAESEIFHKNDILYGLNFIKNQNEIYLVEGYIDVIMMDQFGYPSVAAMGTALSVEHLRKIWVYTDKIIVILDGDEAGIKASERIAMLSLHEIMPGKELFFVQLPNNHDPASYLKEFCSLNGVVRYPLYEYILLNQVVPVDPDGRASFFNKLNDLALNIKDKNLRFEYQKYWNSVKYLKRKTSKAKVTKLTSDYLILLLFKYVLSFPLILDHVAENFLKIEMNEFFRENLLKILNAELCDKVLLDKLEDIYIEKDMAVDVVLSNWYDVYDKVLGCRRNILTSFTQEAWLEYQELIKKENLNEE